MSKPPRKNAEDFRRAATAGAGNNSRRTPSEGAVYTRPPGTAQDAPDITVYMTPELAGFESTLEEALFILTQSPTGRRLIEGAMAAGVGIVIGGETDEKTRGYVDWPERLAYLGRERDPRLLALTLGHELAHVSQYANGGLALNVIDDHPLHALKKFLAIEADARAHEMLIAVELEQPAAKENPARVRFEGMAQLAAAKTDIAALPRLLESALPRLQGGDLPPARFMAACFRAFYYDLDLRATYENILMTRIEALDAATLHSAKSFTRQTDSADFAARLDGHCIAYLSANRDATDIGDPRLAAVSEKTAARLAALHARRSAAGRDEDPAAWKAPVYAPAAPAATAAPARKRAP